MFDFTFITLGEGIPFYVRLYYLIEKAASAQARRNAVRIKPKFQNSVTSKCENAIA